MNEPLKEDLEFLAHFGVKGMKWGVRRGKSKTGVSRRRGAAIDRDERTKALIGKARSGEGNVAIRALAATGKKVLGEKKQNENWDRMVKDLDDRQDRIRSGQLTISDRLAVWNSTNAIDLVVSRTPRG